MQRHDGGPPKHIEPDRLWRLLIQRPRPSLPISFRFGVAPSAALRVVALRGVEESAEWDATEDLVHNDHRYRRLSAAIVARCLFSGDRRVFAADTGPAELDDDEFDALVDAVVAAKRVVSPTYGRSDATAWDRVLMAGAEHPSNVAEAFLLGGCVTDSCWRPDIYFGGHLSELTDGHMMAYHAARKLLRRYQERG